MAEHGAAASYIAKWQRAHPEMMLLAPFCAPAQRPLLEAWGALQHEFTVGMFETSDTRVARTKLAWWGADLAAGPAASQHPLARLLLAQPGVASVAPAQWRQLGMVAVDLSAETRDVSVTLPDTLPAVTAFAERLAEVEAAVFAAPSSSDAVALSARLDLLLRRGGDAEAVQSAAVALLDSGPNSPPASLYREGRLAFDRWRLQRLAAGVPLDALPGVPAWRGLLLAWRAARRSRTPEAAKHEPA
jgi:hypothetical protein